MSALELRKAFILPYVKCKLCGSSGCVHFEKRFCAHGKVHCLDHNFKETRDLENLKEGDEPYYSTLTSKKNIKLKRWKMRLKSLRCYICHKLPPSPDEEDSGDRCFGSIKLDTWRMHFVYIPETREYEPVPRIQKISYIPICCHHDHDEILHNVLRRPIGKNFLCKIEKSFYVSPITCELFGIKYNFSDGYYRKICEKCNEPYLMDRTDYTCTTYLCKMCVEDVYNI